MKRKSQTHDFFPGYKKSIQEESIEKLEAIYRISPHPLLLFDQIGAFKHMKTLNRSFWQIGLDLIKVNHSDYLENCMSSIPLSIDFLDTYIHYLIRENKIQKAYDRLLAQTNIAPFTDHPPFHRLLCILSYYLNKENGSLQVPREHLIQYQKMQGDMDSVAEICYFLDVDVKEPDFGYSRTILHLSTSPDPELAIRVSNEDLWDSKAFEIASHYFMNRWTKEKDQTAGIELLNMYMRRIECFDWDDPEMEHMWDGFIKMIMGHQRQAYEPLFDDKKLWKRLLEIRIKMKGTNEVLDELYGVIIAS